MRKEAGLARARAKHESKVRGIMSLRLGVAIEFLTALSLPAKGVVMLRTSAVACQPHVTPVASGLVTTEKIFTSAPRLFIDMG